MYGVTFMPNLANKLNVVSKYKTSFTKLKKLRNKCGENVGACTKRISH